MAKLHDKDDPNQVKEEQSPYGDEASDDSSSAALHGRVVRLETNARHNANEADVARVEGKVDEAKAELKGDIKTVNTENKAGIARVEGKIDTVNAELSGKIDTVNADLSGKIGEVKTELNGKIDTVKAKTDAKIEWLEKLLYVNIALHIIDFAQDSPIIAKLVNFMATFFR